MEVTPRYKLLTLLTLLTLFKLLKLFYTATTIAHMYYVASIDIGILLSYEDNRQTSLIVWQNSWPKHSKKVSDMHNRTCYFYFSVIFTHFEHEKNNMHPKIHDTNPILEAYINFPSCLFCHL